jgi:hypothetical protein
MSVKEFLFSSRSTPKKLNSTQTKPKKQLYLKKHFSARTIKSISSQKCEILNAKRARTRNRKFLPPL